MPTDYEVIVRAVKERRERERLESMTHDERVRYYNEIVNRRHNQRLARHDELRDVMLSRIPDIEARPGLYRDGDARRIMGRCVHHPTDRNAVLFVLRVSKRIATFPLRLQKGAAVVNAGDQRPAGRMLPRREYRIASRSYNIMCWDAERGVIEPVNRPFTSNAEAQKALRNLVDHATR